MQNKILSAGVRICNLNKQQKRNKVFRTDIVAIMEYNDQIPESEITATMLHKIAQQNGGTYVTGAGRARIEFN